MGRQGLLLTGLGPLRRISGVVTERFPQRKYVRLLHTMNQEFVAWERKYRRIHAVTENEKLRHRYAQRVYSLMSAASKVRKALEVMEELPRLS